MKSIILIIPYFGKWPVWFDAWLKSVEHNPTVNWLCHTDCEIPKEAPNNIKFVKTTLNQFIEEISMQVGVKLPIKIRKLCDYKPAYADAFYSEIKEYKFWGFCDMDVIFGNIRKYLTEEMLNEFDIISSRKYAISGHFNIFKNNKSTRVLYKQVENYKEALSDEKLTIFDEILLTSFINNSNEFKIKWDIILCNQENGIDSHQEYHLNKWMWKDGGVYKLYNNKIIDEVMYLHFINWKVTFKSSDKISLNKNVFYISYFKIHNQKISLILERLNSVKNIFNGYWIKEKRRLRKKKYLSLKKRIKNKLFKIMKF